MARLAESADPFELAFHEGVPVHPRPTEELSATVHEAAGLLGLGEEQVRRLLRDGVLVGIPYGGRRGWRIPRRHLEEFAAERARGQREMAPA